MMKNNETAFDITVHVIKRGNRAHIRLDYNQDPSDVATALWLSLMTIYEVPERKIFSLWEKVADLIRLTRAERKEPDGLN